MSISQITDYLYIAAHPRSDVVDDVEALGVRLVISMLAIRPTRRFHEDPFALLVLPSFDHPRLPIPIFVLKKGVGRALPVLGGGGSVLVYCKEGKHRSVAMASCILIAKGYTADDAMDLIVQQRPVADPHAPHIERQIRRFERAWLKKYAVAKQ